MQAVPTQVCDTFTIETPIEIHFSCLNLSLKSLHAKSTFHIVGTVGVVTLGEGLLPVAGEGENWSSGVASLIFKGLDPNQLPIFSSPATPPLALLLAIYLHIRTTLSSPLSTTPLPFIITHCSSFVLGDNLYACGEGCVRRGREGGG